MLKKKIKIGIKPIGKSFILEKPTNGLEAIINSGIGIISICGGKGTCGKCRIIIPDAKNAPVSKMEKEILTSDEIRQGIRLACQQIFDRDLTIYILPSSLNEEQKLQVEGEEPDIEANPICNKYFLNLRKATLKDIKPDFNRINEALKKEYKAGAKIIDFNVLSQMPFVIRENLWKVTPTLRKNPWGNEIISIEGRNKTGSSYGIAVDLGTTKIAFLLVNLLTGKTIGRMGAINPQIKFGEDVMSRLSFAIQSESNLKKIHSMVIKSINKSVKELCNKNKLIPENIMEMTVVGNTAMHHLFLGLPVNQLALSPFLPLTTVTIHLKAREIGIGISPGAYLYMLPPIAGFVGSDHLAMILATRLYKQEGNCIGIDIGTNTEIALKTKRGIVSVSTASGPAFEGAHIKYGMRAASGAIERIIIDPETCIPSIKTINDKKPKGICGSGILDSIAELLKAGIIDRKGKFKIDNRHLQKDSKGNLQYILSPQFHESLSHKSQHAKYENEYISINQEDIVEVQLAKSAIRTGIKILLEYSGIEFDRIDKIIIAGAFGSYIDPKNAVNIGMFPKFSLEKMTQVGNAAGAGAKMVLISNKERKLAEKIAERIKYLELTTYPAFGDYFAGSTFFPESSEII
jgi:uncharacterized 2Fe-2S/4Fe-4S cluster protein (DUF4445 family)